MISTNVSPSSVLRRRIARESLASGAYSGSSASVATARFDSSSISTSRTVPIVIPAVRTSTSGSRPTASGKPAFTRYFSGFSGVAPPNWSHRKSRIPKHENAKMTIARIRERLGATLIIRRTPPGS